MGVFKQMLKMCFVSCFNVETLSEFCSFFIQYVSNKNWVSYQNMAYDVWKVIRLYTSDILLILQIKVVSVFTLPFVYWHNGILK